MTRTPAFVHALVAARLLSCLVTVTGLALILVALSVLGAAQCDVAHQFKRSSQVFGYNKYQRGEPARYHGAESSGDGWRLVWQSPYVKGPTAIDMIRATVDHLTHLQRTDASSEDNAKMLVHLLKAIEEHDGVKPTIGGELNNLIPKSSDGE